jgi:hypothetical protein
MVQPASLAGDTLDVPLAEPDLCGMAALGKWDLLVVTYL